MHKHYLPLEKVKSTKAKIWNNRNKWEKEESLIIAGSYLFCFPSLPTLPLSPLCPQTTGLLNQGQMLCYSKCTEKDLLPKWMSNIWLLMEPWKTCFMSVAFLHYFKLLSPAQMDKKKQKHKIRWFFITLQIEKIFLSLYLFLPFFFQTAPWLYHLSDMLGLHLPYLCEYFWLYQTAYTLIPERAWFKKDTGLESG